MSAVHKLITDHLDIWTAADTEKKSGRGRASGNANSVYGIKKLRELILELAVRGKLVPQDPNDEPASELLKRIQAEKTKLVAEGKLKKDKLPAADDETIASHCLPDSWIWTTLKSIALVNPRNVADDNLTASFVPMTMIDSKFNTAHEQELRVWKEIKQGFTHFAEGDIGVAKITPCFENSKACVFSNLKNGIGAGTTELHIVRPVSNTLSSRYVLVYFKSPQFLVVGETQMTGTAGQKRLPKEFVESNPFPLPPLAEQHRIVAKVDELMALCDQLEAQHNNAADAHEQLVSHLLSTLTQSQDAADFNANWQRIATHFDTLFTTESSIDALKQTLLQLAVMGKLVPQDPNDEPASELLKQIQTEKAKLIAEGKIKKDKLQTVIDEDEKKFEIPKSWEWCRIGFFASLMSGKGFNASEYSSNGVRLFQIANVSLGYTKWEIENFLPAQYLDLHPDLVLENGDVLVALNRPILNGLMKVCIISNEDLPAILYQRVGKFSFFKNTINTKYFYYFLQSELFINHLEEQLQGSDQPFINQSQLIRFICTIPPSNEQRRIVAKVDELMALCAQLKSRITDGRISQQKLADILVETAASE